MKKQFVKAFFDLHCDWQGLPPSYRIYINDELFAERTFYWENEYLKEILQIEAPAGMYTVKFEPLKPNLATFQMENHGIEHGSARWVDQQTLEIIFDATT